MSSPTRFMRPSSRSTGTRMLGPLGAPAGRGAGRGSASKRARNSGRPNPAQTGATGATSTAGVAATVGSGETTGTVSIGPGSCASEAMSESEVSPRAEVMMARRSWVAPSRASAVSSDTTPPLWRTCLIALVPTNSASVTVELSDSRCSRIAPSRSSI